LYKRIRAKTPLTLQKINIRDWQTNTYTMDERRELYAHPPVKTDHDFLAVRSKIPPRFPVAQNRAAHKVASRFFTPVGGQA
jgi:hypothetical protein